MTLAEMLAAADAASQGIEVSEKKEFKPLPPGEYNVAVENAEGPLDSRRPNPTNPSEFGKHIKLTFSVTDGEYAGRKLFSRNNIIVYPKSMSSDDVRNAQTAMAMGNNERKILLASIGKNGIENANELIGATCRVKVSIVKDKNGNDRNEIKRMMSSSSSSSFSAQSKPATFASAPANNAQPRAKMPWEV